MQFNTNQAKNINNLRKSQKCVEKTYIFMKSKKKHAKTHKTQKKKQETLKMYKKNIMNNIYVKIEQKTQKVKKKVRGKFGEVRGTICFRICPGNLRH